MLQQSRGGVFPRLGVPRRAGNHPTLNEKQPSRRRCGERMIKVKRSWQTPESKRKEPPSTCLRKERRRSVAPRFREEVENQWERERQTKGETQSTSEVSFAIDAKLTFATKTVRNPWWYPALPPPPWRGERQWIAIYIVLSEVSS